MAVSGLTLLWQDFTEDVNTAFEFLLKLTPLLDKADQRCKYEAPCSPGLTGRSSGSPLALCARQYQGTVCLSTPLGRGRRQPLHSCRMPEPLCLPSGAHSVLPPKQRRMSGRASFPTPTTQ